MRTIKSRTTGYTYLVSAEMAYCQPEIGTQTLQPGKLAVEAFAVGDARATGYRLGSRTAVESDSAALEAHHLILVCSEQDRGAVLSFYVKTA